MREDVDMTSTQGSGRREIDLTEAARQLQLAVHDAQVAYDCMGLGDLDAAHTNTLTARAAADAAENILRTTLGESGPPIREIPVEPADPAHGATY
jgi:hypothetical protein